MIVMLLWHQVLFVCTANLVENIPGPLLDRMEVIRLVGYITDEKMHIARGYLEKAAREGSGVKPEQVCESILLSLHVSQTPEWLMLRCLFSLHQVRFPLFLLASPG